MTASRRVLAVLLFAGCGGNPATRGDAGVDSAPKGTVTVTVLSTTLERTPVVGAPVVFDDVDGTVTEIATDASGKAHADVARGASVTAVYVLSTTAHELQTVLDVA